MENKSTGKTVVIVILLLAVIGLGGYIIYDKFIVNDSKPPKEIEETVAVNPSDDVKPVAGSYVYNGIFTSDSNLTATLELKLNEDSTFVLFIGVADAMALRGTYTLNDSKLMLYAVEMDASQDQGGVYEVNSDTFECTYEDDSVIINKWNQHWFDMATKKVDYKTVTDYDGLKLTSKPSFVHIGKDRFVD